MIARISGKLVQKKPSQVVVDVNGVGYGLSVTLATFYSLPEVGGQVTLHVHTIVREDAITLYGFLAMGEREVFERLISVNKIGPKMAASILSGIPFGELAGAVRRKDIARLSMVPGVGKKTAERLCVELADKLDTLEHAVADAGDGEESSLLNDTVEALASLGYNRQEAMRSAKTVLRGDKVKDIQSAVKAALAELSAR
ncbi:MAG: Holliday junction branch migration protein RuvA [Nitrospinae bacterium]|nr:Holliday junction branch migration protein RuvA [Nitrospinota bacterium]MBF0635133.1 Holliday junction branch migration protein RuvA [Nitrospinota bacterium]